LDSRRFNAGLSPAAPAAAGQRRFLISAYVVEGDRMKKQEAEFGAREDTLESVRI
jgi:hypothetical protein